MIGFEVISFKDGRYIVAFEGFRLTAGYYYQEQDPYDKLLIRGKLLAEQLIHLDTDKTEQQLTSAIKTLRGQLAHLRRLYALNREP